MPHVARRRLPFPATASSAVLIALFLGLLGAGPAGAHGFTSTVHAEVISPERGVVQVELGLEYDLLIASAAKAEQDDSLSRDGIEAFESGGADAQVAALESHSESVLAYVTDRFGVTATSQPCTASRPDDYAITSREGVPYAVIALDFACEPADVHEIRSELFADSEGFVRDAKTIVTYDLDLTRGSAALDGDRTTFSTDQSWGERFWEFFTLGAEHLYGGIDHVLFLLALIAGSRRLREIVLAATTFTLAHSVTLLLAALGVVNAPAAVIEPIIALSIAVVAGWHLWRLWRRGTHATDLEVPGGGHLSLDRAGWTRLAVVFCFGLVHGLGFASALGIDQPWSWTLLWSLLVFNLGIEAVQLAIIAAVFPVLALLRHRAPLVGLWATGAIAAGVTAMGLIWFAQRVTGG